MVKYNFIDDNLENLSKTEQIIKSASIIKEKCLSLLKSKNVSNKLIEKQIKINEDVDNYIASLGNIDNVDSDTYYKYLLKMLALFKNAHLFISDCKKTTKYLSEHLFYFNGKVYAICNDKFLEVKNIGGQSAQKVCNQMSEYICYETNEYLSYELNRYLNSTISYDVLGIDYSTIELKNGKVLKVNPTDASFNYDVCYPPFDNTISNDPFNFASESPFDYSIIDSNIIKINYKTCQYEYKDDFDKFFENIKAEIEQKNISHYILDIRGNGGGYSEIIVPLLEYLKEKNITGVTLTDNRVFSSGVFAAYYSKEILNSTLIGQSLGQGNHFGDTVGRICVSDNTIIYSTKYFDFTDVFKKNGNGAIKPDIEVPLTFEDIQNKKDRTLQVAIDYINNELKCDKLSSLK